MLRKHIIPVIMLALMLVILTACPYTSSVPVSQSSEKLEKKLFGKWVKASDADADFPEYYQISEQDKFRYRIEKNEYNTTDSIYDKTVYVSHTTTLGGIVFINMQKDGEGDFYIHRIDLSEDKESFVLFEVTDNIDEKFSSSAELKAFVDKYKELSFFYNSEEKTYTKKED
jgi:hypothetical protein